MHGRHKASHSLGDCCNIAITLIDFGCGGFECYRLSVSIKG
jgi:hypothetical protein